MNKKLLTIDDLYNFYSKKKKSMKFSSEKTGYNIAIQSKGKFEVVDSDDSEGLLYCKIRCFHDLSNKNKSYIETDLLEQRISTMKDRPIMADIVETENVDEDGNPIKDFSGHTMRYDETLDKMIYIELPVGHFVNPDDFHLEYDKQYDRNFAIADCVVYEEYTDTCDILRRREQVDCSVELVIRSMEWDCANKVLKITDFYVQGCTLLGEGVLPGMDGSKLSLKDFSESNNSLFSSITEEEQTKLVDTLEKLNDTLSNISKFNIKDEETQKNYGKEDELLKGEKNKVNNEVTETEEVAVTEEFETSTEEVAETTVTENESEETVETPEVVENAEVTEVEETEVKEVEETTETTEVEEVAENEETKETEVEETEVKVENEVAENETESANFTKTFELSHDDVRSALYMLLAPYEESNNDWYWIVTVYDSYFVYQGCMGNYYGQKYTKDGDNVAFDGERYELYAEFVTESEKSQLEEMRANYSSIQEKLSEYELKEELADKATVFEDKAYSNYLNTEEFKSLMSEETMKKFTKEELVEKADAALGKVVKATKTFSLKDNVEESKPSFFAFAKTESSGFIDALLKK